MKNTTLAIIVVILLIAGITFFIYKKEENNLTGNVTIGDTQKITLSMRNYNYYPNNITVKAGMPVEITLDSSIKGCYRAFTIKDFKISKYSESPADKIVFTPTQKGSYRFACSMGMGFGTINVE